MNRYTKCFLAVMMTFILGIRDGNIALWRDGSPEPVQVFPYRAETLPPEQQRALAEGIHVESPEALEELAENYLS